MTAPTDLEPDAEQVARQLIEQAGRYTRAALEVPEFLEVTRNLLGELVFENAILRHQVEQLARRVEALERRAGVGR